MDDLDSLICGTFGCHMQIHTGWGSKAQEHKDRLILSQAIYGKIGGGFYMYGSLIIQLVRMMVAVINRCLWGWGLVQCSYGSRMRSSHHHPAAVARLSPRLQLGWLWINSWATVISQQKPPGQGEVDRWDDFWASELGFGIALPHYLVQLPDSVVIANDWDDFILFFLPLLYLEFVLLPSANRCPFGCPVSSLWRVMHPWLSASVRGPFVQ